MILLRTVWKDPDEGSAATPISSQTVLSKIWISSEVKYKLKSMRPLGRVTVQGELYVTWILSPVQSQLSHTDYVVFL